MKLARRGPGAACTNAASSGCRSGGSANAAACGNDTPTHTPSVSSRRKRTGNDTSTGISLSESELEEEPHLHPGREYDPVTRRTLVEHDADRDRQVV